jgi:predicted ribosomally synthesized peptide with SipW-like signal peptide
MDSSIRIKLIDIRMKRILLSAGMAVFMGAVIAGGTGAFFSDEETSTGNTFTAGALDLKVDSEAHYNGLVCVDVAEGNAVDYEWHADGEPFVNDAAVPADHYPQPGMACEGSWAEADLGAEHKFFALTDVKPGDEGENTISLHVYDNDAWGRFVISDVEDLDNSCTEPEVEAVEAGDDDDDLDPECDVVGAGNGIDEGELAESIEFYAWLDQGSIIGFQCGNPATGEPGAECDFDPFEGDNIQQPGEPIVITAGPVDDEGETHNIWEGLAAYRATLGTACDATDLNGDGQTLEGEDTSYDVCQGLADDGRMVGSTTYYFGLAWSIPDSVGNEAQTDSLNATLGFEVEQHRNNETPFVPEV